MQGGIHAAACVRHDLAGKARQRGLIHIAFLTGGQNRISTLATWLSTIARARHTDRTFILGSATSPEHPYTWLKFVHPNMLHATRGPVVRRPRRRPAGILLASQIQATTWQVAAIEPLSKRILVR